MLQSQAKGLSGHLLTSSLFATVVSILLIKALFSRNRSTKGTKPRPAASEQKSKKSREHTEPSNKSRGASNRGGRKENLEERKLDSSDKSPRKRKWAPERHVRQRWRICSQVYADYAITIQFYTLNYFSKPPLWLAQCYLVWYAQIAALYHALCNRTTECTRALDDHTSSLDTVWFCLFFSLRAQNTSTFPGNAICHKFRICLKSLKLIFFYRIFFFKSNPTCL